MELSRRQIIQLSLGSAAVAALSGCGIGSDPESPGASGGGVKKGGTLRVGAVGSASNIITDPHATIPNDSDFFRMQLMYDALFVPTSGESNVAGRLAGEWTPDDEMRVWHIAIAEGAKFHDGAEVTPEDVEWSIRRLFETGGPSRVPVKSVNDIKADGERLMITVPTATSILPVLLRLQTMTVPAGTTDFDEGIGSGPFKLESYSNGNSRLVRNDDWHLEPPLLDAVEITRFDSVAALSNAVLSGQVDLASNVGAIAGRSAEGREDVQVIRRPADIVVPIVMRTSDGPFSDPRVREAMRLGADREALVTQALSGLGSVSNDILGAGDPDFDTSLPQRERDVERAKALLEEAGFDTSKTYELITKEEAVGEVESAKAFAVQMRDIGLKIEAVRQESNQFYDSVWCQGPLYTTSWGTNDSVIYMASKFMTTDAVQNETGMKDDEFDAAVARVLMSAPGDAASVEALKEVQRIEYERGGYIAWGVAEGIDLAASKVRDLPALGGYARMQLEKTWVSAGS